MITTNLSQKQMELKQAFNSTKSTEELLKTFQEMETCFNQNDLAIECMTLVQTLVQQNRPQDACIFIMKSNKILLRNDKCSSGNTCSLDDNFFFLYAKGCTVMGSSRLKAKNYDASLKNLNLANMILTIKFENDEASRCAGNCVLRAIQKNEYLLHRVKMFTNKINESALHAKKHLEVLEKLLEEGCLELATANLDVFFAYGMASNYKESLPYGLTALEIQIKHLGSDSVEVANMRFNLSFTYHQLGEHEKGLELRELSDNVLMKIPLDSPDMLIAAGRYEEAVGVLKGKVSRDDMKEDKRALDVLSMAFAFYEMGKFPDAKEHLRTAQEILENCPGILNQISVAALFVRMSGCYEKMNDYEAAISLLKRVLAIPDLPQNLLSQAASNLLSLISQGKEKVEIPYMLELVEILKVSFGSEHCEVGHGYEQLGVAYWNSGERELAVKFLADAKGILDAIIGPNHINSLKTSHTLSEFYSKMGRYAQALEIEEKVVKGLKGLAPSELGFMHEVNKHLNKMKERVAESTTTDSSQPKDGGLSAKIAKCDISDDGKGT